MKGVQCYELFGGIALKNHKIFIIKKGMVCELQLVLRDRDVFCSISVTNHGTVLL